MYKGLIPKLIKLGPGNVYWYIQVTSMCKYRWGSHVCGVRASIIMADEFQLIPITALGSMYTYTNQYCIL